MYLALHNFFFPIRFCPKYIFIFQNQNVLEDITRVLVVVVVVVSYCKRLELYFKEVVFKKKKN